MLRPTLLRPGSRIAVIAPSSPFPRDELLAGLAWLRGRYALSVPSGLFRRAGYLAGADALRLAEITRALLDPSVDAILAARGGFGATRIEAAVPWDALKRHPKWLIGFSDITALHVRAADIGVLSIHGPNATSLARSGPACRASLLAALESGCGGNFEAQVCHRKSPPTEGVAFGGNLSLLCAMAAAGRLRPPPGAIWFVEDVAERPYRIDRMLTSLEPHLSRARAVVFGTFEQCDPGPDGVTVADVIASFSEARTIPVLSGAPFGHGAVNQSLVLGASLTVTASAVRFTQV
jgi:muramoyltetrapeptide carboxypeptidase